MNGARVTGERNRGSNVSYLPVPFCNAHNLQHFIVAARGNDAAVGAPCQCSTRCRCATPPRA